MSFFEEIKTELTKEGFPFPPSFRCSMYGDTAVYIENVKVLADYQEDRVQVALKKGELVIKGRGLYIKKYCEGDLLVCGKITSIEKA